MSESLEVFSAMQLQSPYKTYKKTILGEVYANILDPFSELPTGVILRGNPVVNDETCFVDTWDAKSDIFFRRMNKRHFETGVLIETTRPEESKEVRVESFTDEQLVPIVHLKYYALQKEVNNITSEAVMLRLVNIAEKEERPEGTMKLLRSRLSEIQGQPI